MNREERISVRSPSTQREAMLNAFEQAIVRNARWFVDREDDSGYIGVPADEYYGITGDASSIGHAISVRTMGWVLSGDPMLLESARRSARWLAERQDSRGGWHRDAGFALDAAQCVFEGFCTYERLTGDRSFHEVMVRAADRMVAGTLDAHGNLLIRNLTEVGEYAHFCFLAWKQTREQRFRDAGLQIVSAITDSFDEREGYWNTVVERTSSWPRRLLKPWLRPVLRASVAHMQLEGKTVAKLSEHLLPLLTYGNAPQYGIGLMDAEAVLDTLDSSLTLPDLRAQAARAIEWADQHCAGPVPGSLAESKPVRPSKAVYPLPAINDSANASLWPSACYLLALTALDDRRRYGERADTTACWLLSMQDEDGGFRPHQDPNGDRFGRKYGNINFYASLSLWTYSARYLRGEEPRHRPPSVDAARHSISADTRTRT